MTLQLRDLVDDKVDLTQNNISFKGTSDKKNYQFNYQLFAQINKDQSKFEKTGFHMRFILAKKEAGWWTRLIKQPKKNTFIQCDWDKWVDQDEQQVEGDKGMGGWDPNAMQGFGGGGQQDSDDEGDLQPPAKKLQQEQQKAKS